MKVMKRNTILKRYHKSAPLWLQPFLIKFMLNTKVIDPKDRIESLGAVQYASNQSNEAFIEVFQDNKYDPKKSYVLIVQLGKLNGIEQSALYLMYTNTIEVFICYPKVFSEHQGLRNRVAHINKYILQTWFGNGGSKNPNNRIKQYKFPSYFEGSYQWLVLIFYLRTLRITKEDIENALNNKFSFKIMVTKRNELMKSLDIRLSECFLRINENMNANFNLDEATAKIVANHFHEVGACAKLPLYFRFNIHNVLRMQNPENHWEEKLEKKWNRFKTIENPAKPVFNFA
jgi:hypothetical protein